MTIKSLRLLIQGLAGCVVLVYVNGCTAHKTEKEGRRENKTGNFRIGWSSADITPESPVLIRGQFHARISEGVRDPITATALAMESGEGPYSKRAIMISCDLIGICDDLRDRVRSLLNASIPDFNPDELILNATHTHTAPECGSANDSKSIYGVELDVMSPSDYQEFISGKMAMAAERAWNSRKPGGISFGLGHAVVGHNRLQVDFSGHSQMYGNTNDETFSHIEGYEDHSVNLLYTWDERSRLTGLVVNIACPSQATENDYLISADFWHDTRSLVRQKFGRDVYVLTQCSAAGDQSPHVMVGSKGEARMQGMMGPDSIQTGRQSMGRRKQVAVRIADAVNTVFQYTKSHKDWDPVFNHRMERVELSRRLIDTVDVTDALREAEKWQKQYEQLLRELDENPGIKEEPRWYKDITMSFRLMTRGQSVKDRFELEKARPRLPVEVHVLRIGDIVMATNPFELYLDYGIRMKARSPAVQTFIIQLAGDGTYLPTCRSVSGRAYGAVPASTLVGPEGGQELVEETLKLINDVWMTQN